MTNENEKNFNKMARAVFYMMFAFGYMFFKPLVFQDIYQWHMVTVFDLPDIGYWQAFGLLLLYSAMISPGFRQSKEEPALLLMKLYFHTLLIWGVA
jgi:hypothetical protein